MRARAPYGRVLLDVDVVLLVFLLVVAVVVACPWTADMKRAKRKRIYNLFSLHNLIFRHFLDFFKELLQFVLKIGEHLKCVDVGFVLADAVTVHFLNPAL